MRLLKRTRRANRAQYADVSFQSVSDEEEVAEVSLPSMQGTAEDEGVSSFPSLHGPH